MSLIHKLYKLNKVFTNKCCWTLLQKFDSNIRFLSNVNNKLMEDFYCSKKSSNKYVINSYHGLELNYVRNVVLGQSDKYSGSLSTSLPEENQQQIIILQDVLDKQWISMNVNEILENFKLLSYYVKNNNEESLTDPKYQGILEVMASKAPEYSDEDIKTLLKYLEFWRFDAKNTTFTLFFKAIDQECVKRKDNWSVDEIFLMIDLFFKIRLNRISDFTWYNLNRLGWKVKRLTPTQLVQFAFFLKVNRMIRSPMYNIEFFFEKNFDEFTIDELAVFAMVFTKYNTSIKSMDFLIKIIQKLINEIDTVNDVTLSALLKVIRWRYCPEYVNQVEKLIETLDNKVNEKNINILAHIAFWLKEMRFDKKDFFLKMLNRFEKELPSMSLKSIEKVFYALFTFNYDPKETIPFYSIAFDELLKPEREIAITKHKKSFLNINLSALHCNFYPEKCVKKVMDPEFRKDFFTGYYLSSEYLLMHYILELDHPEYDGPKIDETNRKKLVKQCGALKKYVTSYNKKMISRFHALENITSICQKICGSETAVFEDILLPHFGTFELVLCYDPVTNKYVSSNEQLSQIPLGEIKYAPKNGKEWYAVVLATNLVFTTTDRPTGLLQTRLRHLKQIGYNPITVPLHHWFNKKEDDEKYEFIKKLLPY